MEQSELMLRIRNGDESAFAELLNPLIEKAYKTSYSIVRSKEEAEEVVQNAMLEAYRNIIAGKEIIYFNTWFYKLVSHRSIDNIRKNARMKETVIEMETLKDHRGVMDSVLQEEMQFEISQGIQSLKNGDYRNVLLLYYYQDFTIQEVSEMLGIKTSTVKSHLHRARKALKNQLMENQIIGVSTQ
ncbi:RNA polymerase sigma factor [Bacillus sp. ISL-35]|uniref:RNA polymerase sigma factor n=1 Tax=Bacillus sp. ISL-35 TaxID=2819122 RepID=UPI001BE79AD1|nr:RNA polymerase sigma factor [Bacillus sp. ISL-35]MBT2680133.1 RNA polymerase sigma factor [Bacillus sp. ISL-35]MBT2704407.1 RNA polymerase sigma factor [Chryseobacterium sp. ISL-80]